MKIVIEIYTDTDDVRRTPEKVADSVREFALMAMTDRLCGGSVSNCIHLYKEPSVTDLVKRGTDNAG